MESADIQASAESQSTQHMKSDDTEACAESLSTPDAESGVKEACEESQSTPDAKSGVKEACKESQSTQEMENGDIEVCKIQARKVTQDVMMFVWYGQQIIEKPTSELSLIPEITDEVLTNLGLSIWFESSRKEYIWEDFLTNHRKRMMTTPFLFANYVAYACYLSIKKATDARACFFEVLSLVTHFTLSCFEKTPKFLNICVELFCAFFDKELCTMFEEQGRWKNFNEYIESQGSLKRYREIINAGGDWHVVFKECKDSHRKPHDPYVINDVVLKDITETQVEDEKGMARLFANSVADKMKEWYGKEFEDVLKDFQKTNYQLEELHRKTVGIASGGMESSENRPSLQDVPEALESDNQSPVKEVKRVLKSVPMTTSPKKDQSKEAKVIGPLKTPDPGSSKSLDLRRVPRGSGARPRPRIERSKKLLQEMVGDVENMSALIQFIYSESDVKPPTFKNATTKL